MVSKVGFSSFILCLFVLFTFTFGSEDSGLNERVDWIDYDSALSDSSKPTIVILHKSWCPACKSLKAKLSEHENFEKLSSQFSMVNAKEDDPLHDLAIFDVDGTYIPRVFFLDPNGDVLKDVQNPKGNPNYKYYHYNADTISEAMKSVLKDFPSKDEL